MKRVLLLTSIFALPSFLCLGCASVSRSYDSGYAYHDDEISSARNRRSLERDGAAADLGFTSRELTDREARAVEDRAILNKSERALEGQREREQYFRNKAYFKSDRERVDFLKMDGFEARGRYLSARGIDGSETQNPPEIQALIEVNDITLGMSKSAVRDSWGEPESVEVAGNPIYGNERWSYEEQLPSTEGYTTEFRLVYFEGGRVVGWQKR